MKAQSNIRKFFKRVASMLPDILSPIDAMTATAVNKPEPQAKKERDTTFVPQHEYHKPPRFENQVIAELHRKRKIRNRMAKASRRINYTTA